jgi:hypothetical protein
MNHELRYGNFTSSTIVALTSNPTAKAAKEGAIFGAPALTYIKEKNYERRLGINLNTDSNAKPLSWGNLCEYRIIDLMPLLDYRITSKTTDTHQTINYWRGSKDARKDDEGGTVVDFKCPITRKSFCELVEPLYNGLSGNDAINYIRENHSDGDKYYWQLVSNAIINDCKQAELIVYMPYLSELPIIQELAIQQEVKWIQYADISELPYLLDEGYYKNVNVIRFEILQEDKDFLTNRVLEAGKYLIDVSK